MPPGIDSRFLFTFARKREGSDALWMTPREPLRYLELDDNRIHIVSEGETLHGLASLYFTSLGRLPLFSAANLWWVIADFQPEPIHDPTIRLVGGQRLIIPSTRTVIERVLRPRDDF